MREQFEQWYRRRHSGFMPGFVNGRYNWHDAQSCWEAWKASRSAQTAPQSEFGDAYQGAREDLAIWKRRALEAEAKLRAAEQDGQP